MAKADLNVISRDRSGKGVARSLRRDGKIPAVVYGNGIEPCRLGVDVKELQAAINTGAGWNTLLTLRGADGVEGKVVIVKDMDLDTIRRDPMHVDFYAIDTTAKVQVMVPVHTTGDAVGVKEGGLLQVIRHELEVSCLPGAIPEAVNVDVSALNIGDVVHVEDLALPAGVEAPHEVNFTIITVTGRKGETAEVTEAEEA